jgi:hypothetical protein
VNEGALWLAVVALGAWHGLNPAMGWPLAVAAGLSEKRDAAVFATALPLAAGHFLAMAALLLPFAAAGAALGASRELRVAAGTLVLAFGVLRLLRRRHPRVLARVPPTRLLLWSFLMASAHGAGFMLLPFALGLCSADAGGTPTAPPIGPPVAGLPAGLPADPLAGPLAGVAGAAGVAAVHTAAMLATGLALAWFTYRVAGPGLLRRAWLDLDLAWGASLVLAGATSLALTPH